MKTPFVTKEQLESITARYPTPFHIYDERGIRENARRFEAGEPLLNLMRPTDAVTGEAQSGWSRMMNARLTREQAEKMDLEKYLGKRDWKDPSEWM